MARMLPIEPLIAEIKKKNIISPPTINKPFTPNAFLIIAPETLMVFSVSPFVLFDLLPRTIYN